MTNHATLTTTGWTDWPTIRALIGQDPCLWTDLGDPHDGVPAPPDPPIGATHLWSWRPNRWIRVRLDADRALATILTTDPATTGGTPVTYTHTNAIAWENHNRARRPLTPAG